MHPAPIDFPQLCKDYQRIEQALHFIETNFQRQPELKEIAADLGLSKDHFQRLFTRWAGLSPKRFLQFLTKESAKERLRQGSLLETTYAVGLSSPGRLHDLFIQAEAVTPGEYKTRGAGLTIQYGFHPTPFGEALLGLTARGLCHLSFVQTSREAALAALQADWREAALLEAPSATAALLAPIFSLGAQATPLTLYLTGTNFQLKVWEALLALPQGQVTTYEQIAARIGQKQALRAVGTAIGHNPIAYLIPCHRVIRKMGDFGNYRWGPTRKKALLGWEAAQTLASGI